VVLAADEEFPRDYRRRVGDLLAIFGTRSTAIPPIVNAR
jgi:hypothetical protein